MAIKTYIDHVERILTGEILIDKKVEVITKRKECAYRWKIKPIQNLTLLIIKENICQE